MAKSNKKVRSDRINALRKKYDTFFEEDKKRRDRNEFILGRLEKMRLGSPTPMSVYQENTQVMIKPVSQRSDFLNKLSCRDTNKSTIINQDVPTLSNYNKNIEETTFLKEISKKYILIPKLQSALPNNITYPSIENIKDTDWRSKYSILDELKRNEKETTLEKNDYVFGSTEDHKTTRCIETPSLSLSDPSVLDDCLKPPPKDLSNEPVTDVVSKDETPYSEFKPVAKYNLNIPEENIECNQQMVEQTEAPIKNTKQCDLNVEANGNNKIINEIQEQTIVGLDNKNSEERNNIRYDTPAESRQQKIKENVDTSHEIPESNVSDNIDNDTNSQEIIKEKLINANDNRGLEINNDKDNSTADAKQQPLQLEQETVQQSIQKMSYPEINQEQISKDKVDVTEVVQENIEGNENNDAFLNNPDNYESNKAHEQHTNVEVNNENNHEMTYADGDKNYATNQENNESENYVADNEHYTNEYVYYDESQQREPYVGEVNEHDVSTEQYDPNYEQQYTNNYEDPTMEQYQNNQYGENMYQEQEEANNVTYENQQPDNANFEYVNSDNIEVTGQNQDENAYNYENEINDQQQYDDDISQEYSTVQNEQYEEQQEYIEQEISSNIDTGNGFIENINTNLKENVESINESEDMTKNI